MSILYQVNKNIFNSNIIQKYAFLMLLLCSSLTTYARAESEWIMDSITGCAVWDTQPSENSTVSWSGICLNGYASGHGVLERYQDNVLIYKYVGHYRKGKMNGKGKLTAANGKVYDGDFIEDKLHGHGRFVTANGDEYIGEFRDNKQNGQGTLTNAYGDKFVGEFRDNKQNGQGTLINAYGDKFVGEWRDGNPHGQGTIYFNNGMIEQVEWKNGKRIK